MVVSPNFMPMLFSTMRMAFVDLALEFGRILAAVGIEIGADVGGEREAGGNGEADHGHLGEVGALAAQQGFHVGPAIRFAVAENSKRTCGSSRLVPGLRENS